MTQKLSKLPVNSNVQIIKIDSSGDKILVRRLRDMGIVKGENLIISKLAPLGDPIEIILKGYSLSLRKKEAELIIVKINE